MGYRVKRTINDQDSFEAISALQKSIRRGMEVEAMNWALEMEESGYFDWAVRRIRVTSHEDIGLADMQAVVFANQALDIAEKAHKRQGDNSWRLSLGNAILALCRAEKSREADHFQAAVRGHREDVVLDVPDFALDKHTRRGKSMGRGFDHFLKEGAKLVPKPAKKDAYEAEAIIFWKSGRADKKKKAETPENGTLF